MGAVFAGLRGALEPRVLLLLLAGAVVGLVVGVLPVFGGSVTLALMLHFTFDMAPVEAFAFLMGTFVVTQTAGYIASVLFGISGEANQQRPVDNLPGEELESPAGRALARLRSSHNYSTTRTGRGKR